MSEDGETPLSQEATRRTRGKLLGFDRLRRVRGNEASQQRQEPAAESENADSETASPRWWQRGLPRRRFLKGATAVGAGVVAETYTGELVDTFVEPVEKFSRLVGLLEEGNPVQFLTKLEDLAREYAADSSADNKRKLETWLKFNGMIHYGRLQSQPLAARFVNHFLYGDGKAVDLGQSLPREMQRFFQGLSQERRWSLGVDAELTEREAVELFFQKVLSGEHTKLINTTHGPYAWEKDGEKRTYFSGKPTEELSGKALEVFAVAYAGGSGVEESIMNSLGQATYVASGRVGRGTDGRLEFQSARLSVQDRYDWSAAQDVGIHVRMEQVISELGVAHFFDNRVFKGFKEKDLWITDDDGKFLMDRGLGKSFDIFGQLGEFANFTITPEELARPGDDYMAVHPEARVVEMNGER